MTFGDALEYAKAGRYITRIGWPLRDIVFAEYTSDMSPYLVVQSENRDAIPYFATNIDLFADDWETI